MIVLAAIDPLVGIFGAIVALGGPLVTYLVAARKLSGRIGSSDATELWQESRSIRDWSKAQIEMLTARIAAVEEQNATLASANADLVGQIRDLSELLGAARKEIVDLTGELRTANQRIRELSAELAIEKARPHAGR